jgi:hypothetical protein
MVKFVTFFIGLPKHTQQEQGKEERFTLMKKELKQDGAKQEKLELFFPMVL